MEMRRMRKEFSGLTFLTAAVVVIAVFWFGATGMSGQATRRTPIAGKPNLNGIWQVMNTANWDLLAHGMRPAVAQPGVYPDVPVLAAPVVALGSAGGVPASPGVVEGNMIPYT